MATMASTMADCTISVIYVINFTKKEACLHSLDWTTGLLLDCYWTTGLIFSFSVSRDKFLCLF